MDLESLWDFDRLDESERRFRAALAEAAGDDVTILRTQIARTFRLRGMFVEGTLSWMRSFRYL